MSTLNNFFFCSYGRSPQAIAEYVKTRTPAQVKSHAQKYWLKQKKEQDRLKKLQVDDQTCKDPRNVCITFNDYYLLIYY
jgi:hypothetical protein